MTDDLMNAPGVVEVIPIQDVFCSGVSKIENLGDGLLRVYCYTVQGSSCGDGPLERVLVAKIVLPAAAISGIMLQAKAAISGKTAKPSGLSLVN